MSTLLDPVRDAYLRGSDALKIVRRAVSAPVPIAPTASLVQGTLFDGLPPANVNPQIDALQEDLDDRTVLAYFAAFEAEMFNHLTTQRAQLHIHATAAGSVQLAAGLDDLCRALLDTFKISRIIALFEARAGGVLATDVRVVRNYRDWIAHGKRWARPTQISPLFAYKALNDFLAAL